MLFHAPKPIAASAVCVLVATFMVGPVHAQRSAGGSEVPCAVPMRWRVDGIDARFGLSRDLAERAAKDAGALWSRSVGRDLFVVGSDGSPLIFEYDERQAAVTERSERELAVEIQRDGIERERVVLDQASGRFDARSSEYGRDLAEHNRAVQALNAEIRRWSLEEEIPLEVQSELEVRSEALDRRAHELQDVQRGLNRLADSVRADVDAFNARVGDLTERNFQLSRDFSGSVAESGTYDEVVTRTDGRVTSVSRRIRVYQFASYEALVMVLAHELGHALGLGHARGDGAVMSALIPAGERVLASGSVTAVDARMLSARCPSLGR